ncbi:HupE/UreJ family protein [Pannus brasiliensis CCIBt3594]|uniref:HupE/UreJ family protein n=1 Tax=Pannus brasiliensis CCIBt3594 TaxID=1427578 RepID=A0AAW9QTR9_9CHRO
MKIVFRSGWSRTLSIAALLSLAIAPNALAHHALGGRTPNNFLEGFISGLAHPIIGFDHFAFVVASGLLAVGLEQGLSIPIAFVVATLIGTGIHLQSINLIFPEAIVAVSVIVFGILLTLKSRFSGNSHLYTIALATLAMIAGVFHGYAYGESIVGARAVTLGAYLLGFTTIQLAIAIGAFQIGNLIKEKVSLMKGLGLGIVAIGGAFLIGLK